MLLLMEHYQIVNIFKTNVNTNIYDTIIVNMVIIIYVLLIVHVNRNILNINGSKYKCTCNIVIFKELMSLFLSDSFLEAASHIILNKADSTIVFSPNSMNQGREFLFGS